MGVAAAGAGVAGAGAAVRLLYVQGCGSCGRRGGYRAAGARAYCSEKPSIITDPFLSPG